MDYSLYKTYNIDSNSNLSKKQEALLLKNLNKLLSPNENKNYDIYAEAIIMLICEHARLQDDFIISKDEKNIPYGIKLEKDCVKINLKKLPSSLKSILLRFSISKIEK